MIFNSLTFIFICLIPSILLVLLIEKWGGKHRIFLQNTVLSLFSLLFFAWSGTQHLKILAFLILMNYTAGILSKKNRNFLLAGIGLNLFVLFYFKYLTMLLTAYNDFFHKDIFFGEIIAPLGISFIIFQCISYLMDLYQEKAEISRNFLHFALYIAYFPKLSYIRL